MARTLQTLTIDLTANTANFSAAMTKAQQISLSSTRNIAKSFAAVGVAAAAMSTAVAGAVAGLVAKADEYAASIQRMAEKTGQSTEEISKLAYASALTGGNLDDLGVMLTKFNRAAAESAEGNKKAQGAFKDLGVSVLDSTGHFRPAGALLEETIAKLSSMPESVKKTAVEMDVFGRSGAQLAPVLKVLGTNAAQTANDMKNFGLVLTGPQAEAAERLAESWDRGKMALVGMGSTVLTTAMPALQALSSQVLMLANNGQLVKFAKTIGDDVAKAAMLGGQALSFFQQHAEGIERVVKGIATAEVISFFLRINTSALTGANGLGKLAAGFGSFLGKASGLGPLVKTIGSVGGAAANSARVFGSLAASEGILASATFACQTAWKSFTAALIANPGVVILGALAGGMAILYRAMESNVAEAQQLGGVAVTWHDQWQAAIDNTKDRLTALKQIFVDLSSVSTLGFLKEDVQKFNSIATFGQRAEQIAQQRVKDAQGNQPSSPKPPANPPLPKPDPQPVKPNPYLEEMAKLNTELKNSQLALNAAMQNSVDAQRAATEAGKAGLIVTELQNKLKRDLTATERAAITSRVRDTGENTANTAVVEGLRQRTDASRDALALSQALTAVVGQGEAAEDAAKGSVEASTLARTIGTAAAGKYKDMLSALRVVQDQADAAARTSKAATDVFNLKQDTADTNALAAATLRGAGAVEQETLQLKLNAIAREHKGDPAVIEALTRATIQQTEAEKGLRVVQQGQVFTSPLQQYQRSLEEIARTTSQAAAAGVQIDQTQVWMANREAALQYQQALERIHDVTGSLGDGMRDFFNDMVNSAKSAATMVRETLGQAFEGLNDNLAKLMTGQKAQWGQMFRGLGENVAKMGLQKLEAGALGKLGFGTKADGSQNSPFWVRVAGAPFQAAAGASSVASGAAGAWAGMQSLMNGGSNAKPSSGSWFGSLTSSLLSFIPGFGGHRALGGSVTAGMSYDVGEAGRERFVPNVNGTIIPNNRLRGSGVTNHFHIANGVTPEQTKMYVDNVMQHYHQHVMPSGAVAAVQNHNSRSTSARRF